MNKHSPSKNKKVLIIIFCITLFTGVGYLFYSRTYLHTQSNQNQPILPINDLKTKYVFDQKISDGTIAFSYPSKEFGLATTENQVLARSYIPPCDSNFNYCIYYNGFEYKGSNFESAGLRIQKRKNLKTQETCLKTLPDGYTNITPIVSTKANYSTSVFSPLGDGAAGHYATGALYRLFYSGTCYEFESRIGQTQYANYPTGTIKEFTSSDQADVEAKLLNILETLTLPSGEKISFPHTH